MTVLRFEACPTYADNQILRELMMPFACGGTSKYKVLVADDDSAIRYTIVAMLSSLEHLCHVAADGAEALNKAKGEHFDAVVTDVQMPHMDGITLTRELLKQNPSLPVMVMTGALIRILP